MLKLNIKKNKPCLRLQLNQLEIDIARLQIGDSHDGIDGDARHLFVAFVDDLGAEGRLRCANKVLGVVDREGVGDGVQVPKLEKTCTPAFVTLSTSVADPRCLSRILIFVHP